MQITHLDLNTEEGKKILSEVYLNAVINEPEETFDSFTIDFEAMNQYAQALDIVAELANQGKCTYECDDILTPIPSNIITIEWTEENGISELPLKEVGRLCELSDDLIISSGELYFWQFSKQIYTELRN